MSKYKIEKEIEDKIKKEYRDGDLNDYDYAKLLAQELSFDLRQTRLEKSYIPISVIADIIITNWKPEEVDKLIEELSILTSISDIDIINSFE